MGHTSSMEHRGGLREAGSIAGTHAGELPGFLLARHQQRHPSAHQRIRKAIVRRPRRGRARPAPCACARVAAGDARRPSAPRAAVEGRRPGRGDRPPTGMSLGCSSLVGACLTAIASRRHRPRRSRPPMIPRATASQSRRFLRRAKGAERLLAGDGVVADRGEEHDRGRRAPAATARRRGPSPPPLQPGAEPAGQFVGRFTNCLSSSGITTTANGVPASSVTCGSGSPNGVAPTVVASAYGTNTIMWGRQAPMPGPRC